MQKQYPIEEIALADIQLDRDTQVRASVDEETIRRYFEIMVDEEARDKFPPVTLFQDEHGKRWLADGHHRIMAALRRKFHSILAIVRPGTKEDAIWEAIKENSQNGLPLGRADVRRAVMMVLEAMPEKSLRSIAENVGCSKTYVEKIKNQLSTSGQLTDPEPVKVEGKDGKMYKAKKTKKPKPETTPDTASQSPPVATETPRTESRPIQPDRATDAKPGDESEPSDNRRAEAKALKMQMRETVSVLEAQFARWNEIAPDDMHEELDLDIGDRLRVLCR